MRWLIGAACIAMLTTSTGAYAGETTDKVLSMVSPYCLSEFSSADDKAKCIKNQSFAVMRIAALKQTRGVAVDDALRKCAAGQFPAPKGGINFVEAFKCVSARVPD